MENKLARFLRNTGPVRFFLPLSIVLIVFGIILLSMTPAKYGEVIGINSAKASSSGVEGMGYSIPISKAMPILEKLMARETRTKVDESEASYIGITGEGVSSEATQLYGIPAGIYLITVGEGSPAEEAGLRESDIITEFDGISVTSMSDLREMLLYYAAGETVELTVQSNENGAYAEKTVEITLGSRADLQY